jgi:hypothetical protein
LRQAPIKWTFVPAGDTKFFKRMLPRERKTMSISTAFLPATSAGPPGMADKQKIDGAGRGQ